MIPNLKWVNRFLSLGQEVATWSKDPDHQVGCVLVDNEDGTQYVTGFNGFPKGITDTKIRYSDKALKHSLILHAELNAILNARRDLKNYTLYSTRFPCKRCTLAIIQSGISSIVCITPNTIDIWKHKTEYLESLDLFKESNTDITVILEGKIFSLHLLTKLITNSEERKK